MTAEHSSAERGLLVLASFITVCGILSVNLAGGTVNYAVLGASLALAVMLFGVHLLLDRRKSGGDPFILPLAACLSGFGLTMVLRLKADLFWPQLAWVGLGLLFFLAAITCSQQWEKLSQYKYTCGLAGMLLLLSAIVFGVEIGGHKTWVIIGSMRFQPSEFAKLFIVLFLAAYLNERREVLTLAVRKYGPLVLPRLRFIAPLLVIWLLTMSMFVLQRDMGSALLYFSVTILMVFMASGRISYIIVGFLLFFLGSAACYKLYYHIQIRVDSWLNPWLDPNGTSYQIVQSLFALGSGGMLGSGLGYGSPSLIPEVHTDFVFSAIGEELGFIGAGAILILYILLVYRAFRIALRAKTTFRALTASGLAAVLAVQIFLIIGGVSKFFPLTGITLPFISYGGSSMVSNFILLGVLFSISESEMRPISHDG